MVRVKNILGDDVYGLWHVKKIVLEKGGQRYTIIPNKETFGAKDDAERYAYLRTRRFVEDKLARIDINLIQWRSVARYLATTAFMSLMIVVALSWFKKKY